MKNLLLCSLFFAVAFNLRAQLPAGYIAPDFTLTDINGVDHHLYSYLNDGYIVFIEISATWCGPCWNYHNAGHLKNLYINHGPAGLPNVSENTTDKVMVLFVEGDPNTGPNHLNGTSPTNTQGDWITGTPFPIIDPPGSVVIPWRNAYGLAFYPTIYRICPNRTLTHVGQMTYTNLVNTLSICPEPASDPVDAALLTSFDKTIGCAGSSTNLTTRLQNNGTQPLTSATITATAMGSPVATLNWTGNLETYDFADIVVGTSVFESPVNVTFNVQAAGDNNSINNSITRMYNFTDLVAPSESMNITIKITTDRWGGETTWHLMNGAGDIVANGGPYQTMPTNGAYPQPDVNLTLPYDCYVFEIFDSYGDGMCCAYGAGGYQIIVGGNVIASGGSFDDYDNAVFRTEEAVNIYEVDGMFSASFFPNPFSDVANIELSLAEAGQVKVELINMLGQRVYFYDHGLLNAGFHNLNTQLGHLSTGVYVLHITVGERTVSQRVTAAH